MLKTSQPKRAFSDRRNDWCESTFRISGGREFRTAGPHTENALPPNCVLVRWMTTAMYRGLHNKRVKTYRHRSARQQFVRI